jgi:WD40 repeat protein
MPAANNPSTSTGDVTRDYWCFISYSHADNRQPGRQWATWLQQSLETYEVPADLVGRKNERGDVIPERIFPVFRDEEDLPADADLSRPIEAALRRSRFLVVICSPRAAASKFVDDEIRLFKQLGKERGKEASILAVMIAGEPNAEGNPAKGSAEQECFPKSLRYRVDEQGQLTEERVEPIAADFRLSDGTPGWTGQAPYRETLQSKRTPPQQASTLVEAYAKRHHLMFLKIVAGILGVPLGELTRRDQAYQVALQQRRTKILRRWLAAVSALAVLAVTAGWAALNEADRARTNAKEAEDRRIEAEVQRSLAQQRKADADRDRDAAIATLARSNYFLADARWKENRVAEARELLDAVPPEHRKFEWHLARRESEGSDVTLYGHSGDITSVAYSPDGALLASASGDKTIKIWDARTGEELRTLKGHADTVVSTAFSPDGTYLASASNDRSIKLWEARSGRHIRTLNDHASGVTSIRFSPDGERLVSASDDNTVKLWDRRSGKVLKTLTGSRENVEHAAFSPDGELLASSSDDTIELWDARSGRQIGELKAHASPINCTAFNPDGTLLASASVDSTIKLWDIRSGEVLRTFTGHTDNIRSVTFSPDGTQLASASHDKTTKIWHVLSGAEVCTFTGHADAVTSVAFSPDNERIASASVDNTIKLWNVRHGQEFRLFTPNASTFTIGLSPDGTRLVSASGNGAIKLWDARTGDEIRTLKQHAGVTMVTFSANSARFVSVGDDKTIRIWDAQTGNELRTLSSQPHDINTVVFSRDGRRLASSSRAMFVANDESPVKLWDVDTGKELNSFAEFKHTVLSLAFSPDGKRIASGGADNKVVLWDADSGEEVFEFTGHAGGVSHVTFSQNGHWLASASYDQTIKLWDIRSDQELHKLNQIYRQFADPLLAPLSLKKWKDHAFEILRDRSRTLPGNASRVTSITFSPDGERLISASEDGAIKIWDARTSEDLRTIPGYTGPIVSLAFSGDGGQLVSASRDGSINVYDASARQEVRTLMGHSSTVTDADFSPNGAWLATASFDGNIKIWDVVSGKEVRTLVGHDSAVTCVSFNHDGTQLASASRDGYIGIWDAMSGEAIQFHFKHSGTPATVIFSPDGTRLASTGFALYNNVIEVREGDRYESATHVLTGHTEPVTSVMFSFDGGQIYSESCFGKRIAWSTESGEQIPLPDIWPLDGSSKSRTVDGRCLAVPSGNSVLLVDPHFKNTTNEKAYRNFRSKRDSWWHTQQARSADRNVFSSLATPYESSKALPTSKLMEKTPQRDYYAAAFHWAWVVKAYLDKPEKAAELKQARERLAFCTDKWREEFKAQRKAAAELAEKTTDPAKPKPTPTSDNPDDYLAPIVREMLKK